MLTKVFTIPVQSGATYSANGVARIPLDQILAEVENHPRGEFHAHVRRIEINVDVTFTNANASARIVTAQKIHSVIKRFEMRSGRMKPYNFPSIGGRAVGRDLQRFQHLRLPEASGKADLSINGSSTSATQRLKFALKFEDPRNVSPTGWLYPTGILRGAVIEFTWANGAVANEFGADVSIAAASVRSVVVECITLDHFQLPPLAEWEERDLVALEDATTIAAGRLYQDLYVVPADATGLVHDPITATEVTTVDLVEDGRPTIQGIAPADLVSRWNQDQVPQDALELPQFELNTAEAIPLIYLPRVDGRVTKKTALGNPAKLKLQGTLTPANAKLLMCGIRPTTKDDLTEALVRSGITLPDGYLGNEAAFFGRKTPSKVDAAPWKETFLPMKFYPKGKQ